MPVDIDTNDCAVAVIEDVKKIRLINKKRIIFISKICKKKFSKEILF
jgi:hypothetical protein